MTLARDILLTGAFLVIFYAVAHPQSKPEHPALARYPNWPVEVPARNPYLPPKEFDHPYTGTATLTVTRTDVKGIVAACPHINWEPHMVPTGCAAMNSDRCDVYILNDDLLAVQNVTYDVIWRHERGHCNGWRHAQDYK